MSVKLAAILVLIIGFIAGCNRSGVNEVLLQIGPYKLTVAEYEGIRNSEKYKGFTREQLQHRLIEEGRILAWAMDNQYDTIELLNRQLDYAVRYYASKVDGYVWNKTVKPVLNVTENDIKAAYTSRSNEYYLEFIHFPEEALLKEYDTTGRPVQSAVDFYAMKKRIMANPKVRWYSGYRRYPFYPLGGYMRVTTTPHTGDVWGPVETLHGHYIVHVADKKTVPLRPYEQEKTIIREEILNGLKEKYIYESQRAIFFATHPRMHEDAIADMTAKVDARARKWPGVNPNSVLMEYDFNGAHQLYTVANFIEFVHCQPVFPGSLSNAGDVKKMLRSWLIGIYLFAQAQQMNMEQDSAYQQFRKRYQYSIFLHHYKQHHIYPKISIREEEMENYYRQHTNDFTGFAAAAVRMYTFPDMQSAFEGRKQIIDQWHASTLNKAGNSAGKTKILPPAAMMEVHVKDTVYSKAIITAIAQSASGGVSVPIEDNGHYLVIHLLSKSGLAAMPYKYARDQIRNLLYAKKEHELIAALEFQYPVKANRIKEYQAKAKK